MLDGVVPPHTAGVVATVSLKPNADYQPRFLSSSLVVVDGSSISSSVTKPEGGCLHHQADVADPRAVTDDFGQLPAAAWSSYLRVQPHLEDILGLEEGQGVFQGHVRGQNRDGRSMLRPSLHPCRCRRSGVCADVCAGCGTAAEGDKLSPSALFRVWFSARARR